MFSLLHPNLLLTFDSIRRLRDSYKGNNIRKGPRPRIIASLDTKLVLSPLQQFSNLVRCRGTIKYCYEAEKMTTKALSTPYESQFLLITQANKTS